LKNVFALVLGWYMIFEKTHILRTILVCHNGNIGPTPISTLQPNVDKTFMNTPNQGEFLVLASMFEVMLNLLFTHLNQCGRFCNPMLVLCWIFEKLYMLKVKL
jgi:hypothetical protein